MESRSFGHTIIARIDRGEEILQSLQVLAQQENILLAEVSAIGALSSFTVGVFHTQENRYESNHFEGAYEIVSLNGTISTMDGAYYAHLHMSAGDSRGQVFGGHLNEAVVGATCELVIRIIDGRVDRRFDPEIGLNLFLF